MDATVNAQLVIEAEWERLETGPPEERAAYAAIGIQYDGTWLTEAEDTFVGRIRQKVHLSGYRLAEWLSWNWWRLRWEPRRYSVDWDLAHRMPTIGGGYVWPNITVVSDGELILLETEPTKARPAEPLRYIQKIPAILRAAKFEWAVDEFIEKVVDRIRSEGIAGSNLEVIWKELKEERATPDIALRRTLEALMGMEVDEADEATIERLVRDSAELGERGVQELAVAHRAGTKILTSEQIKSVAFGAGFESNPREAVELLDKSDAALPTNVEAWRRGVAAARALRVQEGLDGEPISNNRLSDFCGVSKNAIESTEKTSPLTFALDERPTKGTIVLRSPYKENRRFELARLLGDRIAVLNGSFKPATRTYTYRQKVQRAFAAAFLCPFEALDKMLDGDFSEEAIKEAAEHFNVSELAVMTLLVVHNRIDPENLNVRLWG